MYDNELKNVLNILSTALAENDYGEDIIKIQHIYGVLEGWQNKIPSTTIIDELEREVDCLELKHDLNDLSYYLSPLCIKIKNEIKNEKVKRIREENRKKRGMK